MPIQILNSLTKKKEDLNPVKGNTVNMYSCGVTVYDQSHIGHARSLYIFEVIRRYLNHRGLDVKFVRNITDIDDKIINKANESKKDWKEVVEDNIALYREDLKALGIPEADIEPRATENIDIMIKHIEGLIEKGYAYENGGDVYFNVRNFKDYGKLSGQSVDQMLEGVRKESGEHKKDPLDFALWKKSKEGEPVWDSPWGGGRPGWHIECSCMSMKHLKTQTLDIHAGGRDLIFPHHENEIAQSEALTGKPFAKYWIHHGLLTINGQKMAKSLGNFITIKDAVEKYGVDDLKMFFLSSHYGSPIDFSEDRMQDAHKANERFDIFFREADRLRSDDLEVTGEKAGFIKEYEEKFLEAMDDDFNTSRAIAVLFELVNETYKQKDKENYAGILQAVNVIIQKLREGIFGLFSQPIIDEASDEIQKLLNEREKARTNKDFKKADEIRDQLREMAIIVEDSSDGQTWRKA